MVQAIALCAVSGLILFAGWAYAGVGKTVRAYTPDNLTRLSQESIPVDKDNVIRLHIRGNSNEGADQEVKERVRDALMERFGETLATLPDAKVARQALENAVPEMEAVANACLKANGFAYAAKAAVKTDYFPDKQYEMADGRTVYLPAGQYTALVVSLGEGKGDNWWCVMYPPLCYLDFVQRTVVLPKKDDDKSAVAAVLVDELRARDVPVEVRSLLLDAIKSGAAKLADFLARARAVAERAMGADLRQ